MIKSSVSIIGPVLEIIFKSFEFLHISPVVVGGLYFTRFCFADQTYGLP